ncbi:MAG TPA: dihydrolipoyl dehydrogenase [Nitrososphaeria archaeon]|nr:dihydrolipoyl dehydrogenase [Nitrososphaeria archaeon]
MSEQYQAIVIGGGPGGYVSAIRLGQHGIKTLLIEKDVLGGECLNRGCIPSKILINGVNIFWAAKNSPWIISEKLSIDFGKLQSFKNGVLRRLRAGIKYLLNGNGVKVVEGDARLKSENEVLVKLKDGSEKKFTGEKIVIATGSEHVNLPMIPFDGKKVFSSSDALNFAKVPKKMLIVGGGVAGLEIGTFYAKLGTKLIIVELMPQILPGLEKDLVEHVEKTLKSLGAEIYVNSKVVSSEVSDDVVKAQVEGKDGNFEVEADCAVVSVGKRASTKELEVEEAGVKVDKRGFIVVDEYLRSSVENIYAVGDVTGPPFLAHRASYHGLIAADNIAGRDLKVDESCIPAAIFTDPEIAFVGLTREEAEKRGFKPKVGKFPFSALGRALAERHGEGFVRIVVDENSGKILGAQMVGAHVSELIAEIALAMRNGLTIEQLARVVRPHPTYSEIITEAAEAALWKPIHILMK